MASSLLDSASWFEENVIIVLSAGWFGRDIFETRFYTDGFWKRFGLLARSPDAG